jgi:hypothetical protein
MIASSVFYQDKGKDEGEEGVEDGEGGMRM